jgi:hypothetical protein
MKIDLERFLALTAMLAAPLVTANGCILTGSDDDDANSTDDGASADDDGSDPSGNPTSVDDAPMTDDTATDGGTLGTTGTDDADTGTGTDPTGDTSGGTDTTGGGNELGNCCEPAGIAGCEVQEVADCVCAEDPFCCETEWDISCAAEVNTLGCGECQLPPQVWDCYCTADCDGTVVDTPWQVCSGDELDAAEMGVVACEADLGKQCEMFVCDECSCFTAEVPEIDCP